MRREIHCFCQDKSSMVIRIHKPVFASLCVVVIAFACICMSGCNQSDQAPNANALPGDSEVQVPESTPNRSTSFIQLCQGTDDDAMPAKLMQGVDHRAQRQRTFLRTHDLQPVRQHPGLRRARSRQPPRPVDRSPRHGLHRHPGESGLRPASAAPRSAKLTTARPISASARRRRN